MMPELDRKWTPDRFQEKNQQAESDLNIGQLEALKRSKANVVAVVVLWRTAQVRNVDGQGIPSFNHTF